MEDEPVHTMLGPRNSGSMFVFSFVAFRLTRTTCGSRPSLSQNAGNYLSSFVAPSKARPAPSAHTTLVCIPPRPCLLPPSLLTPPYLPAPLSLSREIEYTRFCPRRTPPR